MSETFYNIEDALAYADKTDGVTMATGYLYDNDTKTHVISPHSAIPPANGAGGIMSNVLDYTHWVRMFLRPNNSSNAVSTAAIAEMTKPHMVLDPGQVPLLGAAYGLGLEMGVYRGHKVVTHEGGINGYMTTIFWVPDLDWGLAMMQNTYSLGMETIQWKMLEDFLRTPEEERFNMVKVASDMQVEKIERLENARKTLYLDAGEVTAVAPSLPLQAYEGIYNDPAYHNITLTISTEHSETLPGAPLPLYSQSAYYLNILSVWHHVSGEDWYMHGKWGPSWWLIDELKKARFCLGVDGKFKGLELQAESAIEELSWFQKVA